LCTNLLGCNNITTRPKLKSAFNVDSFFTTIKSDSAQQIQQALTNKNLDDLAIAKLQFALFKTKDLYKESSYKILKPIIENETLLKESKEGELLLAKVFLSNCYQYVLQDDQVNILEACNKYQIYTNASLDSAKRNYVQVTKAIAYLKLGDNKKGIVTLEKELEACKLHNAVLADKLIVINNLINAYEIAEDTVKQLDIITYALSLPLSTDEKAIKFCQKLSLNLKNGKVTLAKAINDYKEIINNTTSDEVIMQAKQYLSEAYYMSKDYKNAKRVILSIDTNSFYEHRAISKTYYYAAHLCEELQQLDSARYYYDLSIKMMQEVIVKNGHLYPTAPAAVENTIYDALIGKCNIILADKTASLALLNIASDFLNIAEGISHALRKELMFEASKLENSFDTKLVSDKKLAVSYRKFLLTNNAKYKEDAFLIIESSKAVALQDKASQEIISTKLKDTNYNKLQELHRRLNEIELLQQSTLDNKILDSLKKISNEIYRNLDIYKGLSNEVVPKSKNITSIQSIAAYLKKQNAIAIHYFKATDGLHITSYNPFTGESSWTILPISTMDSIGKLAISQANPFDNNYQLSNYVYNKIWQPFFTAEELKQHTIFVFGDNIINNISFDALIMNSKGKPIYLIQEATIAQGYSINSLMMQEQRNVSNSKNALIVTPFSDRPRLGLPILNNSKTEAIMMKQSLDVLHLSDKKASYAAFKNNLNQNGILHIATHATAQEPAQIAFYDTLLKMPSLFETPMYHKLAYINTCQSGAGVSNICEGNLSIGRVLYYNGVHNIIVTLWNMDDNSSSLISNEFYESLSKNKSSIHALRNAKLNYLNSQPLDKQTPYYWASVIHFGDGNIQLNEFNNIKIGLLALLIGGIVSMVWWLKIKKTNDLLITEF
jgi:CHAT domain-containing protein